MKKCELCEKLIKPLGFASHQRTCHGKRLCFHCNLQIMNRNQKFCSLDCANKHQKCKNFSLDHRLKISKSLKNRSLTAEHKAKISSANKGQIGYSWSIEERQIQSERRKAYLAEHPEKHPNALCRGKKSYPQELLTRKLEEAGFVTKCEFYLDGFWIDILVNDVLAIEVDGEYWHKNRKDVDDAKTEVVSRVYEVKRYSATAVMKKIDDIIDEIKQRVASLTGKTQHLHC